MENNIIMKSVKKYAECHKMTVLQAVETNDVKDYLKYHGVEMIYAPCYLPHQWLIFPVGAMDILRKGVS